VDEDEWGRDPAVAGMRSVFAAIEASQARFLDGLGVSRLDGRLRQWRKMALHLFEQGRAVATRRGMPLAEKDAADLYLYCLAKVLGTRGIEAPHLCLPDNPAVMRLLEETR
jgi:predicted trehalose synthase